MLPLLRRSTRAIGILMLIVALTPVQAFDCAKAASGDVMPCCIENGNTTAALDAGCCTIQQQTQVPDRGPAVPSVSVRQPGAAAAITVDIGVAAPNASDRLAFASALDGGPPLERLYLRLSNIRR